VPVADKELGVNEVLPSEVEGEVLGEEAASPLPISKGV